MNQILLEMKTLKISTLLTFALSLTLSLESSAQCNTSMIAAPSSLINDTTYGATAWSDLNNASSSDDNYSWSSAITLGDTTQRLMVTDFSFTIPPTASICGVEVTFEHSATGTLHSVSDNAIRLIKGGVVLGDNKAKSAVWSSTDTEVAYGDSTDTWGITLSPADINASDFGVAIAVDLSGVSVLPTARIDQVNIKVNYSASVLPIELIGFEGNRLDNNYVEIIWSTATETNNDYFTIERSTDGVQWEVVGGFNGAGTSKTMIDYAFQDNNNLEVPSFYRLKQTDFDGQFEYSEAIEVEAAFNEVAGGVQVFPNPSTNGNMTFRSQHGVASVKIFDHMGTMVTSITNGTCSAGSVTSDIAVQAPSHLSGAFVAQLTDCSGQEFFQQVIYK